MAIDITRCNSDNDIKNYTMVTKMPTSVPVFTTGIYRNDNAVDNSTVYADISGKYADRYDDPTYYTA